MVQLASEKLVEPKKSKDKRSKWIKGQLTKRSNEIENDQRLLVDTKLKRIKGRKVNMLSKAR